MNYVPNPNFVPNTGGEVAKAPIGITFGVTPNNKISPVCQCGNGNHPYSKGFLPYWKKMVMIDDRGRKKEVKRQAVICAECHLSTLLVDFNSERQRVEEELKKHLKQLEDEKKEKAA